MPADARYEVPDYFTAQTRVESVEVGQHWLYQPPAGKSLRRAVVVKIPKAHPPRVLVSFPNHEAADELAPPSRLIVPFDDKPAYLARLARWRTVDEAKPARTDSESYACETVAHAADLHRAVSVWSGADSTSILDESAVRAAVGDQLVNDAIADAASFCENGRWVLPWRAAEPIFTTLARAHAEAVLVKIRQEEVENREQIAHGGNKALHYRSGFEAIYAPMHAVLRAWLGQAVDDFDEREHLRAIIARQDAALADAIRTLRQHNLGDAAKRIELTRSEAESATES
jgi:hypothetical protein